MNRDEDKERLTVINQMEHNTKTQGRTSSKKTDLSQKNVAEIIRRDIFNW